ncbi:hypothetical protein OYC64_015316 [Pagothenia borchgrevinki]|uniref:Uncharacterized protein n=1 Tax=Pagothenia borchgrevinki TaxID=8213 RepID=A0ABD2HH21_PAGBO
MHPTPANGQHINAEVNKEVEIRVRAQASHAILHDIIISGPLNITKHRSTHGDFVIRWTPGPDDVGDHYPICVAVQSVIDPASTLPPQTTIYYGYHFHIPQSQKPGIYQSEMRCVLMNIGKILVESHVTCHESSMMVTDLLSLDFMRIIYASMTPATQPATCRQTPTARTSSPSYPSTPVGLRSR